MMRTITGCVSILALCAAHPATAVSDCKDIGIDGVRHESVPGRLIVQPKDVEDFQNLLKGDLGRLHGERLQVRPIRQRATVGTIPRRRCCTQPRTSRSLL